MASRTLALIALPLLLVFAACSGSDSTSTPGTATTAPSGTASATATAAGSATPGGTTTATASASVTDTPTATATTSETPDETPTGPVDTSNGNCNVRVSGDETLEYTGAGGNSAVGTDYWYTDEEMRAILRQLASFGGDLSDEELDKQVEEDMMKDPRFILLLLNCVSEDGTGSISITPSSPSKYADVPFGPKTYVIKAGQGVFGSSDVPGEISILMTLGDASYKVAKDGKLDITKFDNSGITGTFNFGAEEVFPDEGTTAKVITVEGTLDFGCTGPSVCD